MGITAAERSSLLPDLLAIAEVTPGYSLVSWQAILAPAKLTPELVHRLNQEIVRTLNDTCVRKELLSQGYEAWPSSPQATRRFIQDEMNRYGKLVKSVTVQPD